MTLLQSTAVWGNSLRRDFGHRVLAVLQVGYVLLLLKILDADDLMTRRAAMDANLGGGLL